MFVFISLSLSLPPFFLISNILSLFYTQVLSYRLVAKD